MGSSYSSISSLISKPSISNGNSSPLSNKIFFKGPYQHQAWSLPDSIIYYITKNPSSPKAYQKIIQSCKYFFSKNSLIIVTSLLIVEKNEGNAYLNDTKEFIKLSNFNKNFWITSTFRHYNLTTKKNLASSIIPNIYSITPSEITLHQIHISFHEFLFLFSNAYDVCLYRVTVKNEDGSIVPLENLVRVVRSACIFEFHDDPVSSSFTLNTVKEILKTSLFISRFILNGIPETFDIEMFNTFMKKRKSRKFCLNFRSDLSQEYKNRLDKVNDEYVGKEKPCYKSPCIYFVGSSHKKYKCRICPRY